MSNHSIACDYINRYKSLTLDELVDAMTFKWFRLNTLYHIKDKSGQKVLLKPNEEQEQFYIEQHCRDIILKARQLGFTTFKMISDLDDCLFNQNFSAGCICHNLESAKDVYRNKIRFAYQSITPEQREVIAMMGYELPAAVSDKDNGYVFSNGSSIKVSTGYRGGTLQSLHISEFGSICKKFPDKAKEIVTGAFEAVAAGNVVTIESTAEGREGYFHDYCIEAERMQKLNKELNVLDFKFHFFPWHSREEYAIKGEITPSLVKYFDDLEFKHEVALSDEQKAWYSSKMKSLGDDMKREYPSTPKEAFEVSIEGAYYANQFSQVYKDGRICKGFGNEADVYTAWDIGVGDSTCIWFYQKVGNEIHLIDYYENSGEGLEHYARVLKRKPYQYARHYAPHDIDNRDFSGKGKTRKEMAREGFDIDGQHYSLNFVKVAKLSIEDGINYARKMLERCVFDQDTCERGIQCLEAYRKQWNDKLGCYRDQPLHDWASDGADAFRYLAVVEEGSRKVGRINMRASG